MKHINYTTVGFAVAVALSMPLIAFAAWGLVPCDGVSVDCDLNQFIVLIKTVIDFLLFKVAMPLAAISFMVAGFMMMTAGGNTQKVSTAKTIFWYVFVGLIIALAAWLVVEAILKGMGLKSQFWLLG